MKIMIDIPEEVYNRCKEYRLQCGEAEVLESAVARGTPLPETNDGDLISRQEVSDIIKTRLYQTALNNDEYITSYAKVCEDIAENRIDTWINEAKSVKPEKCGDCISREAAFDEIIWDSDNGVIDAKVAIEALRKLPSVEPERKRGKWIENKWGEETCSECGYTHKAEGSNSCPNCEAKMEV